MIRRQPRTSTTEVRAATYGVRGLTCGRCLVSAIEEVRALPGVDMVRVDLVPFGESLVTVAPDGAVSGDQVRTTLRQVGFEVVNRRPTPVSLRVHNHAHPARVR